MRLSSAASLFLLGCLPLRAQNPGARLAVDVTVTSVVIRGDTVGVTYVVYNRPGSQDSLARFFVDAPATVKRISTPQPDSDYSVLGSYRGRPVANWAFLGLIAPAATSASLYFESVGVPDIVTDWASGGFGPPNVNDATAVPSDRILYHSVPGKTVGVTGWPADRTPAGLLSRLRGLTQSICAAPLLWITDATLCSQLLNDIDQAQTYRANGQITEARAALDHFIGLVSGPNGTPASGVTNAGYWLLVPNATIIKNAL